MSANAPVFPAKLRRASANAAGTPISMASVADTAPTISDRMVAAIHCGDARYSRYHFSEKPRGGQSMNPLVVKDTGTMKNAGSARNARRSRQQLHSTARDPAAAGRSARGGRRRSHTSATRSDAAPRL